MLAAADVVVATSTHGEILQQYFSLGPNTAMFAYDSMAAEFAGVVASS
jgi:hypothetical protein